MSNAIIGYGSSFSYGNESTVAATTVWTPVGEVKTFDLPAITVDEVDVTNMDSPNAFKEYIFGLKDGGNITITLNYDKSELEALYGLLRIKRGFQATVPDTDGTGDGSVWTFDGFVTSVSGNVAVADAIELSVSIRVTGNVEFTPAA